MRSSSFSKRQGHIQLARRKNLGKDRIIKMVARLIMDLGHYMCRISGSFPPTPDTPEIFPISVNNTNICPVGQVKSPRNHSFTFPSFPYPPQTLSFRTPCQLYLQKSEFGHFSTSTTTFLAQASITCLDPSQQDPCIVLQSILHNTGIAAF